MEWELIFDLCERDYKMKIKTRFLVVLIVFAALHSSSCASITHEETIPTLPLTEVPRATNSPIASLLSTETVSTRLELSCWPIKPLHKGSEVKGSFVYVNYNNPNTSNSKHIFAWDMNSFRSMMINQDNLKPNLRDRGYVSPDGRNIAIVSDRNLVLVSQNGIQTFPLPKDGILIRAYLPDGRILMIDTQNRDSAYTEGVGFTDIYYLLNPVTGEIIKHDVFLPGFQLELHNTFIIQYSPDMKYVVYKSMSAENTRFTLYNLEKKEVVWVGPELESSLKNKAWTVPVWQPNAKSLTNIYLDENGSNYYSISLDGKVSPITNFQGVSVYTTQSDAWWSGYAEFANWSPNGRYLVFSGSQKGEPYQVMGSSLYIWDNQEKAVYKPCLPNETGRFQRQYFTNWSFDGNQFIVTLAFASQADAASSGKTPKSYIINLADKTIYELPDDNNRGEFSTIYSDGLNQLWGWLNWEIP